MSRRMTTRVLVLVIVALIFSSQVFAATGLLRVGSRGSAVTDLQNKLNSLGYNAGKADGIFGSRTRSAVMDFQKANGLKVDGIAGPATMAKLNGGAAPSKPSDPKPETPPATGGSGSAPITQLLRQGSKNAQVKTLQQRLNELGYNAGTADGIFGSRTRSAVIAFQKAKGLAADGIVGPATVGKLYPSTSNPKPADPKPADPKPNPPATEKAPITQTLRQGSRGDQVKILQQKLNSLGYNAGTADGIFGSKTRAAVIAFQKAKGLAADGIVGPATIAKLYPPTSQPKPEEPKPDPKPEEPKPDPGTGVVLYKPERGSLAGKTIILDPGHGGSDPGAVWNGNQEKKFNLDMSLRLERILKEAGATVIMTRRTDTYSYLFYRSAFVNKYIVDLELKNQEAQKKALEADKDKKTADLNGMVKELASKGTEKEQTQDSITKLNTDIKARQAELDALKAESNLDELEQELETLIGERDALGYDEQGLIDAIAELEAKIAELEAKIAEFEAKITELEAEIANLDEEDLGTKEEDANAEEGNGGEEEDFSKELEELKSKLKPLTDLRQRIEDKKQAVEKAWKPINDKQAEIDAMTKQKSDFEALLKTIGDRIKQINTDKPILEADIKDLEIKIYAVNTQIIDLNDKAGLLQDNLRNPSRNSRVGIYKPSSEVGGKNIINNKLKEILDLTRAKYDKNMIFIAVHCNASGGSSPTTTASGVQVYYRNSASDSNDRVNTNYYKNYNDAARLRLAQAMLKNTRENTNFKGRWTTPFKKDFHVLREQNLPSVLMEIGFVNNPDDVKLLNQEQTRENAAKGMYLGIVEYFKN